MILRSSEYYFLHTTELQKKEFLSTQMEWLLSFWLGKCLQTFPYTIGGYGRL